MKDKTDWDAYYLRPARSAKITRRITANKLRRSFSTKINKSNLRVCELGGGNSCFIDQFLGMTNLIRYHVIDLNEYSMSLLTDRLGVNAAVTYEIRDLTLSREAPEKFDIVYSVGLIEHFDKAGTEKCIAAHLELCAAGGVVVITFPTPTVPYRIIRFFAETLNLWMFPDERPLLFDEVERAVVAAGGEVVNKSINWLIGLTQGYVEVIKAGQR